MEKHPYKPEIRLSRVVELVLDYATAVVLGITLGLMIAYSM